MTKLLEEFIELVPTEGISSIVGGVALHKDINNGTHCSGVNNGRNCDVINHGRNCSVVNNNVSFCAEINNWGNCDDIVKIS